MCDDKGLISKAAVLALGDDDAEDLKQVAATVQRDGIFFSFENFDSDNSGGLTYEEFGQAAKALGNHIDPNHLEELCKGIDKSGDGVIDEEEFVFARGGNGVIPLHLNVRVSGRPRSRGRIHLSRALRVSIARPRMRHVERDTAERGASRASAFDVPRSRRAGQVHPVAVRDHRGAAAGPGPEEGGRHLRPPREQRRADGLRRGAGDPQETADGGDGQDARRGQGLALAPPPLRPDAERGHDGEHGGGPGRGARAAPRRGAHHPRDPQGRKRVIQRRFNVGVFEAIPNRKASTL